MATQSFLKAVTLRGKKDAQSFIRAVERSREHSENQNARYERQQVKDMDLDTIKKVFGEAQRNDS